MNRFILLLPAALALAATAPARADSRTVDGHTLVATLDVDSTVTIETDSSLHGEVRLSADDLSCVQASSGATVSAAGCSDGLGRLRITVPEGAPVTISHGGDGTVHIGNLTGPLVANITGSGELTAARTGPLVLNVQGSGDSTVDEVNGPANLNSDASGSVRLRHVNGPLQVRQSGSGDLVVGGINGPAANIVIEGSGDAVIGKGTLGALRAQLSGSGDLVVAATSSSADLQASGGGDIKVAHVNGQVHKSASGGSTISVINSDIAQFGIGKMAQLVADADETQGTTIHVGRSHSGGGPLHFFAGVAVLVMIYVIWRTVQRNGGMAGVQNRFRGPGQPPLPTHPGVIAVRDTMSRLEGRLARVEGYVTTREFDLQRKFRELDANK